MECETPRDLQMPYLRAIQKIPGNTAGEKFSWIGKLSLRQTSGDLEQVPPELLPILRVETAIKKKRHEDITSALKCEDLTIINRAFKAAWFFDGSHKKIVDVTYFCERLFPYVSMNTRMRVVITLAHRLSGKDPIFAQQMFTAVASAYGVKTAYPLFMACDEAFAYKTIVEKELVLPVEIVKKIFRKNPDLIVRFLKLLKHKKVNATERTPFAIGISRYTFLLPKLIKKRVEAFMELYETHLPDIILSNTCAEIFLKKARQHVIKKPLVYIRILPLNKINVRLMESIFPNLLARDIFSFYTDEMLNYLEHYPNDKKYELLRKSYKNKYNVDLLDTIRNITPALLQILPAEERIKQARIKIRENLTMYPISNTMEYERDWICYLSVNEAIPAIKEKISKTPDEKDRLSLIKQMIYVCKINGDDDALSDTLTYFLNRHKNENCWIFEDIFNQLLQMYDVPHLSEKQASLVLDIVRLYYVKQKFVPEKIFEAMIHFNLIHNMSIEELLDMYMDEDKEKINIYILQKYPHYQRQWLVTCANLFKKRHYEDFIIKKSDFCQLVEAMCYFNDKCKRSRTKIEKITIRDYPWLMDTIREEICSETDFFVVQDILRKNEPELYRSWLSKNIVDVTSGAALALLKRDLQNILDNWEEYLADCMKKCHCKRVQHFIRTTRWYKNLPIKFAEYCMDYVHEKHKSTDEISSSVTILAILLHGDTVTKLIDPLTPTETTIDFSHPDAKNNYNIVQDLSLSMKLSNPPIPLDLVVRLCKGDYMSIALMILTNVSRRTSLPKVISIAQKMISMRVSVRKHGIRLMDLTSIREFMDFLQKTWTTESHYSIRQVLFEKIQRIFLTEPRNETWSLYCQTMSMLNLDDEALLSEMKLFPDIPNEYIAKYLDLWLKTIDDFQRMGLDVAKTNIYIRTCLKTLTASVLHLLPEQFFENILQKFLFHIDIIVSAEARRITILYILTEDKEKHATRFKEFADVLHNAVTADSDQLEKLCVYQVNKKMNFFIKDFVASYKLCFNTINPQIIDNMQMIYSSVFSPKQDATSYLLLVYAKKLQECKEFSSKESWLNFGLKIGQQLHELIDIFSSLLISFMAEVLKSFLNDIDNCGEITLGVIHGLIEAGNANSYFMAATMLPPIINEKYKAEYHQLMEKFREIHQEAATTTVLYNHLINKNIYSIL